MSYVSFQTKETVEKFTPTLAYNLDIGPNCRFRKLSACTLTYESNEPEYVEVHIAQPRRYGVVEDVNTNLVPNTGVFAL